MPRLMITSGDSRGQSFELNGRQVIGRHPECEIVINDPHASRKHAVVNTVNNQSTISDNGSSNGTFVNGASVQSQLLRDGDEVCVSSTFFLYMAVSPDTAQAPKRATLSGFASGGIAAGLSSVPSRGRIAIDKPVASSGQIKLIGGDSVGGDKQIAFDASIDASQSLVMGLAPVGKTDKDKDAALKKATQRLEVLVSLASSLATIKDIDTMLKMIMDKMFAIFTQATRGFLLMNTNNTIEGLKPSVVRNKDAAPGSEPVVEVSKTVLREALNNKKAVLFSDASSANDDAFSGAMSLALLEIRSVMCVPILLGNDLFGVVYIDTKDKIRAFTEDDVGLLSAVTTQAAISIKNFRMAETMAREAEVRSSMAKYLSPDLVDQFMNGNMTIEMGGTRKIGTVFFSDLISFSKWSLTKQPEEVMDVLNQYFHVMEEVIFRFNGSIDKTMGDAIMAMWGVLVPQADGPVRAVAAAVEMQNLLYVFSKKLERTGGKIPGMGIGLNTGEFVAGNIGSDQKVEYTILGKNVNMGQRLESMAGYGQVYISQGTYSAIKKDAIVLQLPNVSIKGWEQPVPAYSVRGIRYMEEVQGGEKRPMFILSIPLVSKIPAGWPKEVPDYVGVITRAIPSKNVLTFELWCFTELGINAAVQFQPFVQEKALPVIDGVVRACSRVEDESMGERWRVLLEVSKLPAALQQVLRVGGCTMADWTTPDQIVRGHSVV